jgi:AcrR family transcriptional regulator
VAGPARGRRRRACGGRAGSAHAPPENGLSALDVDALLAADGVRPPQQARSQATFDRLLDAAERLLTEVGLEDTSMAAVAARAGSSVGALYTRVPDKAALVRAVQLRILNRQLTAMEALAADTRLSAAPLDEVVERFVAGVVVAIRAHAGVVRAFLVQGVRDPVMRERVVLGLEAATAMLAGLLRERSDVDHPDPELAADVVVRTIVGALQQTILLDRPFPEERYVAELSRAARCYLTAPPAV